MAFVQCLPVSSARKPIAGAACGPPRRAHAAMPARRGAAAVRMAATAGEVPDLAKRRTMNLLLFGAASSVAASCLYPLGMFFVPRKAGGAGGGVVAKDALGNDVKKADYLKSHPAGSRQLVQGLKGDATYLIVNDQGDDLEFFALNAVCTHLGCVVPWNRAEQKFMCPCHGSQYSKTGAVVRGPAPLPLALERVEEDEGGNVVLKSWGKAETDFRTNDTPWWNF